MPASSSSSDAMMETGDGRGGQSPEAPTREARAVSASPHASPANTPVVPSETVHQTPGGVNGLAADLVFGPYCILEELGRGGMGVVYHVADTRLGREVALKKIRSGVLALPEEIERFTREAKAIAQLKHPYIVQLYDVGAIDGQHYYTMELAPAGSVADHRTRFQLNRRDAVTLMARVARAIEYVHAQHVFHRDLKPANILLRDDDQPLISDFGLAKSGGADRDLTHTGQAIGTPSYMAPEQVVANPSQVGYATDIWALGVVAYELLCGKKPFVGKDDRSVTEAILHDAPPLPRTACRSLDRDLETILLKCLEKMPGQRYASAGALADDLEAWLAGQPIKARPLSRLRRVVRYANRRRGLVAAVALGVLTVVALSVAQPWADPDAPLREIEAQFAERETISWEGGVPAWSKPLSPVQVISRRYDDAITLSSRTWGLLQLLGEHKVPKYRFEADIRLDSYPECLAGLFVCQSHHELPDGTLDAFALAEVAYRPAMSNEDYRISFSLVHAVPKHPNHRWRPLAIENATKKLKSSAKWRHVVFTASVERVSLRVDNVEVVDLPAGQRRALAAQWHTGWPDILDVPLPVFSARGGLGLFVSGTASFRNVTLTPE